MPCFAWCWYFGAGIRNIKARNLIDALDEAVINRKRPLLGICLGMQLLGRYSDEASNVQGLNWIPGNVKKINRIQVRLPHMGFNEVKPSAQGSELFKGMEDGSDFYFVHSYYFQADNDENIISTSSYGSVFASGIQHGNIVGVQFHPEKSQSNGLQFLKNFIEFSSAF